MKVRFERGGTVLEFERPPMKESRFRALCALAAAGVYAGMVWAVAALCGLLGLVVLGAVMMLLAVLVTA